MINLFSRLNLESSSFQNLDGQSCQIVYTTIEYTIANSIIITIATVGDKASKIDVIFLISHFMYDLLDTASMFSFKEFVG